MSVLKGNRGQGARDEKSLIIFVQIFGAAAR
jgi:hypothetical protein